MIRIAVILPAYNEEQTISATIEDFYNELPDAAIWVVNNRSTDETQKKAQETLMNLGCKGGIINENRPGKGNAVRRAFLNIDADIYILADADLTYPAAQVHKLLAPIINGEADMVVGDRHSEGHYEAENKRALHGFGNRLVRGLVNKLFKAQLADIMSGYRVFNRAFVKSYPILVEGFEIETDMTLHALDKRFRIVEIPINYRDRPEGSLSKLNTFRDGARVLSTIGNILRYYRPLVFFGGAALIFAIIGIVAGVPVIDEWVRERFISHIPLAILATGLEIVAIIFAAIGLILDSITHQDKLNFERDHLSR
ncbi:glycosyltransferase [Yersinia mollaretii]|uniref:glycosyltransferase family 2 protein n=1 Tax=Yersinia mollaretii TaxID=33060 RepID=UPI001427DE1B|nr:glycosyltransferase family 2 protein [Yersinia mollaretii]MDA5534836.1 glycosyltransferase family 2 protein [Yersinia mollaretii]NIL02754.1 glycosyltransferase [Yersinia mollaretii]